MPPQSKSLSYASELVWPLISYLNFFFFTGVIYILFIYLFSYLSISLTIAFLFYSIEDCDGGHTPPEEHEPGDLPGSGTKGKPRNYEMKRPITGARGIAVIISNTNFDNKPDLKREGTKSDEERLTNMFKMLGYRVLLYRDCKYEAILSIFNEDVPGKSAQLKNHDSFVCCILSHGDEGIIYASDWKGVSLTNITSTVKKYEFLYDKPKMFFIQACRGSEFDRCWTPDGVSLSSNAIPIEADFFFGYATPAGYFSFRQAEGNPGDEGDETGSLYLRQLYLTFEKHAKHTSLIDMHTIINDEVSKVSISCQNPDTKVVVKCRQIPEVQHRLRADIYFFEQWES